jgi:hypothetical protein
MEYTLEVHRWNWKRQSHKCRAATKGEEALFRHTTVEAFKKYMTDMQAICQNRGTVTYATATVHRCESRQAVNKYGAGPCLRLANEALLEHVQAGLQKTRRHLFATGGTDECFLLQMLQSVITLTGFDVTASTETAEPTDCLAALARANLSPKLVLEGIPEWVALRDQLAKVNALTHTTPREVKLGRRALGTALKACGSKQWHHGKRRPVKLLRRDMRKIFKRGKENTKAWSTQRKGVLEKEMRIRGGNPFPSKGGGVRTHLSTVDMRRWLTEHTHAQN